MRDKIIGYYSNVSPNTKLTVALASQNNRLAKCRKGEKQLSMYDTDHGAYATCHSAGVI